MRKIIFILLLSFFSTPTFGQYLFKNSIPYDSSYVTKFPSKWSARLYGVSKYVHFNLANPGENNSVKFIPNYKIAIGLGASYGSLVLDLGVNIFSYKKTDTVNTSKSFNFIGSLFRGHQLITVNGQYNKGFIATPETSNQTAIPAFRSDIKALNFQIIYNYNFNSEKYSFTAAYMGSEIQRRTAGTPIAGAFASYFYLDADSNILPNTVSDEFNSGAQFSRANIFSAGLLGGYAFTVVLPKSIYFALFLTPGISFNFGNTKDELGAQVVNPSPVSFKLVSGAAIGYGGKKFYTLATFAIDNNYVGIRNNNTLNYFPGKAKLVFGYRLKWKTQS